MSEHLLEMAKALVRVKDGKVEVLTEPGIRCCPLRQNLYGIQEESRETVQRVLEGHMQELGMYGPNRVLELQEEPVSFGASEILADAIERGAGGCSRAGLRGRGHCGGDKAGGLAGDWSPYDGSYQDRADKGDPGRAWRRGAASCWTGRAPWIRFRDLSGQKRQVSRRSQ